MNRKSVRRLLRMSSRVPGLYTVLAFILARRVTVSGWSMAPSLLPGERLLIDRLAYARDKPRRDEVVLAAHPLEPNLRVVKRLIGVPGDVVDDGITLGRGQYWVEGDNPEGSTDSRVFGPLRRSDLLGRAWLRYWPAERWEKL